MSRPSTAANSRVYLPCNAFSMQSSLQCKTRVVATQDLIGRLLERKPGRRLGMLSGRAADVKRHKWFDGMDWAALINRRVEPGRKPREDSAKRLKELMVRGSINWSAVMSYGEPPLGGQPGPSRQTARHWTCTCDLRKTAVRLSRYEWFR